MDPPPAFDQRDQTVRDEVNIAGNAARVDLHIWRQHSILRAYARGRLRAAGQLDAVAGRHAPACAAAMHTADWAYELLPAGAHDLDLAPTIIAAAENLMAPSVFRVYLWPVDVGAPPTWLTDAA